MVEDLQHEMRIAPTRNERARQEFIGALRAYILVDMADEMRERYERDLAPNYERRHGHAPADGPEVHELMQGDDYFRFYSAVRYNAQEMVFRSVIPAVERELPDIIERGRALRSRIEPVGGGAETVEGFEVPRSVSRIDVHLAPGSYNREYAPDDVAAGAIYDNAINVFAFNQMGRNLDDIGWTMANYVRLKYPDFHPQRILDCGCTVGHNTVPWKKTYPEAEVHGIDVGAPVLRYAAARAASLDAPIRFRQMSATQLDYPDDHFDVVFSSMFLHELPLKDIRRYLREAHRVLRPGGLMLHMELPPNSSMAPYDQFYLDWDSYYNNEPYYKPFRDQDLRALCREAGFADEQFVELVAPRYTYTDEAEFRRAIDEGPAFDDRTGRLSEELRWYAFGSWK